MNSKASWYWTALAVGLFVFIFFFERHLHQAPPGPPKVLPALKAGAVTRIQILPRGQLEICAERTNGTWQLTKPFVYPAQRAGMESLLAVLERLTAATYISPQELKDIRQADQKFGFDPPQISLILRQADEEVLVHVGFRTAPGDQVFVQVVGVGAIYIVDADLLNLIPNKADDWRDPRLVDLNRITFDRLLVTNAGKAFALQRNPTNKLWRMILPGWEPRADSDKVEEALERLQNLRAEQFVSEDPKADLDSFGLQLPELRLALAQGTNTVLLLEFGKSPTNNPAQIYTRRADQYSVVTASRDILGSWSHEGFRDRHLVTLAAPLSAIEVSAQDHFVLQRQANDSWRVEPQGFAADPGLVHALITNLAGLKVADFVQDTIIAPDLPAKGLDPAARQYVLRAAMNNALDGLTNTLVEKIDFGAAAQEDRIFARRTDESSLYTVKLADVASLPSASWQMRDRQVWNFNENEVAGIVIHQEGRTWEIDRRGTNNWALAPGYQGIINDLAMDEVAHQLGGLTAAIWVARGDTNRAAYGFATNGHVVTVELKTGRKLTVEFGGTAPSGFPYAVTILDDEPWVFEFPWPLYYQYVKTYLTIPIYIH